MDEEIDLKQIISKSSIVFNSNATSKEEAIRELAVGMAQSELICDVDGFLNDVYEREQLGLTGIGNGIAIPHGKSEYVNQTAIGVGLLKDEIKWETIDQKPVKIIFLFAVKNQDSSNKHLLLLQQVAIKIANDKFVEQLKNASDRDYIYTLLCN